MTSRMAPRQWQPNSGPYAITNDRLREIRAQKMYPFFDVDQKGGVGDLEVNINTQNTQVNKQLNFLLPFFGFGLNYTWVSWCVCMCVCVCVPISSLLQSPSLHLISPFIYLSIPPILPSVLLFFLPFMSPLHIFPSLLRFSPSYSTLSLSTPSFSPSYPPSLPSPFTSSLQQYLRSSYRCPSTGI